MASKCSLQLTRLISILMLQSHIHTCVCHNPTKCHSPRQMSQQPSTNVTANDKCHNFASTNVTANDKCHNFASTNVTANDKCHNFASTNVTAKDKCHNFAATNVTANDKCHNITMISNDKWHHLPTNVSRHITWTGRITLSLVGCRTILGSRPIISLLEFFID